MELCSGVDSVRDDVISCVTACCSVGWLTVSFEARVKVESEAQFFKTESVAGEWGGLSVSLASALAV